MGKAERRRRTTLKQTNGIKQNAVIVALQADNGNLQIAGLLRVAKSFVHNPKMNG